MAIFVWAEWADGKHPARRGRKSPRGARRRRPNAAMRRRKIERVDLRICAKTDEQLRTDQGQALGFGEKRSVTTRYSDRHSGLNIHAAPKLRRAETNTLAYDVREGRDVFSSYARVAAARVLL